MTTLDALIEWARTYEMTEAEKREQRISFVYGNCHIANERVTREMVEEADERLRLDAPPCK
jgi:chromosome condensin MukBEF complex kleisin-like MukF subunit